MNEKATVLFYKSFRDAARELPPDQRLAFYEAVIDYGLEGIEPEEPGVIKALFAIVKPLIDSSSNRYTACVENGRKGGRPKNQSETKEKPKENQSKTKDETSGFEGENLKVKVKVKVKVKDNVNDNDNDNGKVKVNVNDEAQTETASTADRSAIPEPTFDNVCAYFEATKSPVDALKFYEFYGSYVGLKGLDDWQAYADYWTKTEYKNKKGSKSS